MGGAAANVLIVEDESELGKLFEIWLTDRYDVTTVSTGKAAVAALDHPVDILILDWRLPDISGEAIVARTREADRDIGVAVVTGSKPAAASADGVDMVLTKPITKLELRQAVEELH